MAPCCAAYDTIDWNGLYCGLINADLLHPTPQFETMDAAAAADPAVGLFLGSRFRASS
eukprot:jgi/Psemu1/313591/fgenesh1_kg.1240_\